MENDRSRRYGRYVTSERVDRFAFFWFIFDRNIVFKYEWNDREDKCGLEIIGRGHKNMVNIYFIHFNITVNYFPIHL